MFCMYLPISKVKMYLNTWFSLPKIALNKELIEICKIILKESNCHANK